MKEELLSKTYLPEACGSDQRKKLINILAQV